MSSHYRPSISEEICRHLYSVLLILLLTIVCLLFLARVISGRASFNKRVWERFRVQLPQVKEGGLLVHCVSVGEVVTAAKLIKAIRQQQGEIPVTITTTTATGSAQVVNSFGDTVTHCYLPVDLPWLMGSLLNRCQPSQLLITEVELWPNLIHQAWRQQIPVSLINARLTQKSAQRYSKIGKLFKPMLHKITHICAQGQRDVSHYRLMGVDKNTLHLCQNIKFDLEISGTDKTRTEELAKTLALHHHAVLIAASTHESEEKPILEAFSTLSQRFSDLRLIIVPRYPQRFDEVYELCQQTRFQTHRLSTGVSPDTNSQIILGDVMGQLNSLYGLADMAFVGGSIATRGGHNPLEAAIHGMPILMGKSRHNNPQICQVLADAGVLFEVEEHKQIDELCGQWLSDPALRGPIGEAAINVVNQNRGAINRTLAILF